MELLECIFGNKWRKYVPFGKILYRQIPLLVLLYHVA